MTAVSRHFAAVRVFTETREYHLNFDRLVAAVELLNDGTPGRLSEALRDRYPTLTVQQVHDYFCAAQTVVSNDIDLKGMEP